jgi:hypothetical protein
VPELVGSGSFVARSRRSDVTRSMAAMAVEDPVDLTMTEWPDPTSPELGRNPPAVPVGQQADGQDQAFEGWRQVARPTDPRAIEERREAALGVARPPAEQARPAAAGLRADRAERLATRPSAGARPDDVGSSLPDRSGRSPLAVARPGWRRTGSPGPPDSGSAAAVAADLAYDREWNSGIRALLEGHVSQSHLHRGTSLSTRISVVLVDASGRPARSELALTRVCDRLRIIGAPRL